MALSAIQFQRGLPLSEFQRLHGSEGKYQAALENTSWHRLLYPPPFNTPPRPSHFAGPLPQARRWMVLCCAIIKGLLLGDINSNPPVKPLP